MDNILAHIHPDLRIPKFRRPPSRAATSPSRNWGLCCCCRSSSCGSPLLEAAVPHISSTGYDKSSRGDGRNPARSADWRRIVADGRQKSNPQRLRSRSTYVERCNRGQFDQQQAPVNGLSPSCLVGNQAAVHYSGVREHLLYACRSSLASPAYATLLQRKPWISAQEPRAEWLRVLSRLLRWQFIYS